MTRPDIPHDSRVTLVIDRLRVSGKTGAETAALVSALRETLAARLAADPAALLHLQGADRLRLTLPPARAEGPAALGRAAGDRIAGALTGPRKGGG